jgi:hypothetical protein
LPVATIVHALTLAKQAGKRVYVCAGNYAEHVTIDKNVDGVNVYGGLDCSAWTWAANNSVKVAPATTAYRRTRPTRANRASQRS